MTNATKVVRQQETIFTLLKTHANDRGYVKGLDIDRIARLTGITAHDVTKTLWGLQKRNLLGFSERKGTGGHSIPYRFRIKKQGLNASQDEVAAAEPIDLPEEMVETEVAFTTNDPIVAGLLDGAVVTVRPPEQPDYIRALVNRENDLRFAATILGDHGLEELGLQVLEHIKLSDDEFKALRQYFEVS